MTDIIHALAMESKTERHELIAEMLDYYGVDGTVELTEQQKADYYAMIHRDTRPTKTYMPLRRKDIKL